MSMEWARVTHAISHVLPLHTWTIYGFLAGFRRGAGAMVGKCWTDFMLALVDMWASAMRAGDEMRWSLRYIDCLYMGSK